MFIVLLCLVCPNVFSVLVYPTVSCSVLLCGLYGCVLQCVTVCGVYYCMLQCCAGRVYGMDSYVCSVRGSVCRTRMYYFVSLAVCVKLCLLVCLAVLL